LRREVGAPVELADLWPALVKLCHPDVHAPVRQGRAPEVTLALLPWRRVWRRVVAVERPPIPVLVLSVEEACASLGCSYHFWSEPARHEVRIVRVGRRKMVAVAEL
jgi:hypothetical protein